MSPHDPPAPDLGPKPFTPAQRAQQLERMNSPTAVFLAGRLLINRYEATVVALEQENIAQAARLAAVEPVLRAYREQHDICAADPDEGFDRCPCEICDAAVAAGAVEAGEARDAG